MRSVGAQAHEDFHRRERQPLAGAHDERDAAPAWRAQAEAQRDIGFRPRVRRDAGVVAIAGVLPAHDVLRREGIDRFERGDARVVPGFDVIAARVLHREQRHHLQQVILHDVA